MTSRTVTSLPYTELPVAEGNYGPQSDRQPIDRVVIHTMVGTVSSAASRFNSKGTQVSAHYGIGVDGQIYHFLEEYLVAYHAGDYPMNCRSIGIEHEDGGDYNGVRPDALYIASAKLVKDICQFYGIPIDREHIIKHSEVIPTGCPDALDIDRIVKLAGGEPSVEVPADTFENLVKKSSEDDAFHEAGFNSPDDAKSAIQKLIDDKNSIEHDKEILEQKLNETADQLLKCENSLSSPPEPVQPSTAPQNEPYTIKLDLRPVKLPYAIIKYGPTN